MQFEVKNFIMKKILMLFLISAFAWTIKSQSNDTILMEFPTTDELIKDIEDLEITLNKLIDSTFNYSVSFPDSLELIDTGSDRIFAGILPTPNNEENSISITSFFKNEFSSWDRFVEVFITGNKPGQQTLFSPEHILYGFSTNDTPFKLGVRKRLFTISNNKIFNYEFALVETPTAYLWIQYGSTPDTYDYNIERFNQFLDSFEILK